MRAVPWLAVVAASLAGVLGCNRYSGETDARTAGAVAVIDLDEVASRLGSDKQIADSMTAREAQLRQQLTQLAQSYNQQITERKKAEPEAAGSDKGVQLAAFEQAAEAKFSQVKRQAAADLSAHKAQLITRFRDQIRPAARKIANERGLSVIVTKNDAVIYDYSATVDITDEVIEALQTAAVPAPVQATAK